jgi:hydrogenase-4 component F
VTRFRETAGVILPPLAFLGCSLWLGLATPPWLVNAWTEVVNLMTP